MPNHSIQQINQILQQQKNGGSSTKQKDKLSRKLMNFFINKNRIHQGYYIDLNNILILKDIE